MKKRKRSARIKISLILANIAENYGAILNINRITKCQRDEMKKITLCGSTKFKADFERVMAEETLKGNIVISVGLFGHDTGLDMNSDTKRMLDRMHFEKIDMADEILVINPGGYIGLSTCDEIHYAIARRVKVTWLEIPDCWEDPFKQLGLCENCSHAVKKFGEWRERGYTAPCLTCSRPEMSNFEQRIT